MGLAAGPAPQGHRSSRRGACSLRRFVWDLTAFQLTRKKKLVHEMALD